MSDKRQIRKDIKRLGKVKTWQLLILLVLSLFVSATFLRLNNTGMVSRRSAVESADKSGDESAIASRVSDLQRYSASHMNAESGVFYLKESYNRDVEAAVDAVNTSSDQTPQARAKAICKPNLQTHGYSKAYQDCMMNELNKSGQVMDPTDVTLPNPALYYYSFASPLWSPDFAGFSIIFSALLAIAIVGRLVTLLILRILLRRHYKSAF